MMVRNWASKRASHYAAMMVWSLDLKMVKNWAEMRA